MGTAATVEMSRDVEISRRTILAALTVDSETLDQSANDHDNGTTKDRPAAAETVIDDTNERQGEDGAEGVRGGDDALELGGQSPFRGVREICQTQH